MSIANAGKDVEKLDKSHLAGEIVKWYNHSGKQSGSFLKNNNNKNLTYITTGHLFQ